MKPLVSEQSEKHLVEQYDGIEYGAATLQAFMREALDTMRGVAGFSPADALLDIGCGRGYFLRFLREQGFARVEGLEPCDGLAAAALTDAVRRGSFEDNPMADGSHDVVYTCHTLHHLHDAYPVHAVREMLRIARRHVVIVELNNTNLAMFLRSYAKKGVEINAHLYSKGRVASMLKDCGARIVYSGDMKASYISGDSVLHKLAYHVGAPPYNITIASAG